MSIDPGVGGPQLLVRLSGLLFFLNCFASCLLLLLQGTAAPGADRPTFVRPFRLIYPYPRGGNDFSFFDYSFERDVVHRTNEGYRACRMLKSVLSNKGLGIKA